MVVRSDKATLGDKELRDDWPVDEGLEAGTTKRSAESASLKPQEEDLTPKRWGEL